MASKDLPQTLDWESPCESAECLELATVTDGPHLGAIALREGTAPDEVIVTSRASFAQFVLAAQAGRFDHLLGESQA